MATQCNQPYNERFQEFHLAASEAANDSEGTMSEKPRILIQLDPDKHASAFDGVVAIDAGVHHLFQYDSVAREDVRNIVHGAIFTRGVDTLHSTAIFVGGSDVAKGEQLFQEAVHSFFGPMRVSVMLDSNGANSTAAAAILCLEKHLPLAGASLFVAAATGPVGRRVCRMALSLGAKVYAHSRKQERAEQLRSELGKQEQCVAVGDDHRQQVEEALSASTAIIACGAAGIQLWTADQLQSIGKNLAVAVDLNAVPPAGLEGIKATDKAVDRNGRIDYGALGAGGLKMKIHKAAIAKLFVSNSQIIDAEQMLEIGRTL